MTSQGQGSTAPSYQFRCRGGRAIRACRSSGARLKIAVMAMLFIHCNQNTTNDAKARQGRPVDRWIRTINSGQLSRAALHELAVRRLPPKSAGVRRSATRLCPGMGAFNRADIDSAAGGNGTLRLLDNRDTTRAIQTLKLTVKKAAAPWPGILAPHKKPCK